ncbi:Multidrug and toxin extrusion protein 2-like [Oopsacas minuta]|uniref:Multidrug and toxin extrusion protein n=1 Tax=Oopsacas minuta TaxID=111878 RepID=A0AAV7JY39_9METZ|nr:Multidrug and toxin extrusion protein 2-like [Oopsacas minuta]
MRFFSDQFKRKLSVIYRHWFSEEVRWIWALIWPNFVTNQCFTFILTSGPIIFAGKILDSTTMLAGVTFCVTFFLIVAFMPLYGVASSLDTLATQAFGAKDYKMLGIYLQRGMLILFILCMPISAILLQLEELLLLIGEDTEIASISAKMMLYSLLLLPLLTMVIFVKVAEAQSIVIPTALLLLMGAIIDVLATIIILYLMTKSVIGLAVGGFVSMLLTFGLFLVYMYMSGIMKKIWGGFSWRAFCGWPEILLLGLPISIGLVTDAVIVELGSFLVGLGDDKPAIQISIYAILICLSDFLELCSYAVFIGVSVRVGNLVGAGEIARSKRAAVTGVIISLVMTGTILLLMCIPKNYIGYLFVSDKEVVEGISELVVYLIPTSLLMALVYALNGVLSGYGKQWVIIIQVIVALLVGLPISLVLTGYGWGARGYWIGVIAGYIVKFLVALLINFYYLFCAKIMRISSEQTQNDEERVPLVAGVETTVENLTMFNQVKEKLTVKFSMSWSYSYIGKKSRILCKWLIPIFYVLFCLSFFVSLITCKYSDMEHIIHVHTHLKYSVRVCCMRFVFNNSNSSNTSGF